MPMMKQGACLSYSHGFNIVEEGMKIREECFNKRTPVCTWCTQGAWATPVDRHEPQGDGLEIAKAYAAATGGDRAGVLLSSFVAEVKSDLMGEQTILCGMLQTGAVLSFDKMVANGIEPGYASKLIQYGWETITEALKHGGITGMMNRLDNPSKVMLGWH
eukprot:g28060.t1